MDFSMHLPRLSYPAYDDDDDDGYGDGYGDVMVCYDDDDDMMVLTSPNHDLIYDTFSVVVEC